MLGRSRQQVDQRLAENLKELQQLLEQANRGERKGGLGFAIKVFGLGAMVGGGLALLSFSRSGGAGRRTQDRATLRAEQVESTEDEAGQLAEQAIAQATTLRRP